MCSFLQLREEEAEKSIDRVEALATGWKSEGEAGVYISMRTIDVANSDQRLQVLLLFRVKKVRYEVGVGYEKSCRNTCLLSRVEPVVHLGSYILSLRMINVSLPHVRHGTRGRE